ncbi:uncharacterized protein Z519_10719 [Cladophialophora bantiana CBS 173.52]|uniref:rRNA-processing protein EFG1 n=1 Tax=Cladophialophora bantiana (strain ATCC 10958 / CBS 173.52 / CDC B-1940 / NIH 8579) TaxID=1442370 RepID=A0A0D2H5T6_CLAB1|nr:uncharacterized protein Z519_10719 [Cladophialophora bantiana CBS 173.52]KIW88673.1 hypothetical protein Z519_10719 [Cladophialophora bantiana CBS 173.52]
MAKSRTPRPSTGHRYRPTRSQYDSYRPPQDRTSEVNHPEQDLDRDGRGNASNRDGMGLPPVRSAVSKTKHERATNPSTKIHSLRRLLASRELPGTVRQEKERELAALLFDQRKSQLAQDARKNLQRYHFVRFMERKKAERVLKKLLKGRDSEEYQEPGYKSKLEKLIHVAEVDINYTKYAPLGDKYISLFVQEEKVKKKQKLKLDKGEVGNFDEDQQEEFRHFADQLSNVVRSATGDKPPMWYEVEKLMEEGEAKLQALREGKLTTDKRLEKELASLGGKEEAGMRSGNGIQLEETRPSWLDDDGIINPADLDNEQDEEMSDGGFFER